ncbi:membrane associated zinc metalloprotease [Legionella donaldsonii]|uniref:Membrane associated zinc metalloprotease n=1 Tax=Legionella donaldsonii TaxID=45060 RepID=A0A378J1W9_9GAMM|nr:site-2 protease family protein [Legionella donaldsonii]STX41268.1 membrane associated zinc metalloprotease [Legionella donaldsonii]
MILALLAIVLTLVMVVGIHEAGHAIAAKWFAVKIQRISIGFGKPLLTWRGKSGCEWVWAIWPLGGYVQLLNSRIQPVPKKEYNTCFDKKPVWVRCVILLAGAGANLVTAWLMLTIMFTIGYQQNAPVIQKVVPQSLAAKAGFKAGDQITSIAAQETSSWQEVGMRLIMVLGKAEVRINVLDSEKKSRSLTLDLQKWTYKRGAGTLLTTLGIEPDSLKQHRYQVKGQSLLSSMWHSIEKIGQLLIFFLVILKQLLTGMIPFAVLLGPIGLLAASANSFMQGFAVFLYFIASLSLVVGLVNLFPVPGLDGGSIIYALVEKIRGKPVPVAWELLLHRLAVIVFCVLLVQLILNDLQRYLTS